MFLFLLGLIVFPTPPIHWNIIGDKCVQCEKKHFQFNVCKWNDDFDSIIEYWAFKIWNTLFYRISKYFQCMSITDNLEITAAQLNTMCLQEILCCSVSNKVINNSPLSTTQFWIDSGSRSFTLRLQRHFLPTANEVAGR